MARDGGGRALVIGVGNDFRSDDRVGLIVARALRARAGTGCAVVEHDGETAGLLETWRGAETVVLVDALVSGAAAGTIHRFDAHTLTLPRGLSCSTHGLGIAEAVALGRAMGRLPRRLVIYGIEGRDFEAGRALSPEVERAVPGVVRRVLEELSPEAAPAGEREDPFMHEASLITGLIRRIEGVVSEQGGGRVVGVTVRLGALSHISPEHFREHFVHGARGTVAEDARLDIEVLTDAADPRAQEILLDSVELAG